MLKIENHCVPHYAYALKFSNFSVLLFKIGLIFLVGSSGVPGDGIFACRQLALNVFFVFQVSWGNEKQGIWS